MGIVAPNPYAPDAVVPSATTGTTHGQMRTIGKWVNPPGWIGRHMWDGWTTPYEKNGKVYEIPNLFFVGDHADYIAKLNDEIPGERWKDAKELPAEMRETMLEFYIDDLTPSMRVLLADQIAAREARTASRPKPRTPQRRDETPAPRAGAASKKKRGKR